MYIQNRIIAAFCKLSLGLISLYGLWLTLAAFGATSWRLFSTWPLFIGSLYFCLAAIMLIFRRRDTADLTPCAMLDGLLVVAFIVQGVVAIVCAVNHYVTPSLTGFAAILIYYLLPVLALLDWCLFNRKGQWRVADPFYWLALPLSYAAIIICTANILPSSTALLYPVAFLDYNTNGFWEMLAWLSLISLLILILGYILVILDAFMAGSIAKHIVMPHIRTVAVDEHQAPSTPSEHQAPTPNKPQAPSPSEQQAPTPSEQPAPAEEPKPAAEAQPSAAPAQKAAKTKTNKTQKSQPAQKPPKASSAQPAAAKPAPKTQPARGRKINDIAKPKAANKSPRRGKAANNIHKRTS